MKTQEKSRKMLRSIYNGSYFSRNTHLLTILSLFLLLSSFTLSAQIFNDQEDAYTMSVTSTGNMGIGTTSPTEKLEVVGNVAATKFIGDGSELINLPGSTELDFLNGNVGIGTDNPTALLHLSGSESSLHGAAAAVKISNSATNGGNWFLRSGATGTITPEGGFSIANDSGYMMAITNNGNVGIGTISPTEKLEVIGNVAATKFIGDGSELINLPGSTELDFLNGNVGIGTDNPTALLHLSGSESSLHGAAAAVKISNSATNGGNWFLRSGATGTITPEGGFSIASDSGYMMAITNNGNVGVGTISPTQKLEVIGNVAATKFIGDGSELINLPAPAELGFLNGNVGIGTNAPTAKLSIKASDNSRADSNGILVYNSDNLNDRHAIIATRVAGESSGDPYISWDIAGIGGWSMGIDNSDNDKFKIGSNSGDPGTGTTVTIDRSNGNVGVGTISPTQKLEVIGNVAATKFIGDGSELINLPAPAELGFLNGNVGIGTNTPTAKLSIKASDNSRADSNGILVYNSDNLNDRHAIIATRVAGESSGDPYISWDIAGIGGWSMGIDNSDNDKFKIGSNSGDPGTGTTVTIDRSNGNVGIGTTTPTESLQVIGTIKTNSIISSARSFPDYVFTKEYKIQPLLELESYVKEYHHLPNMPTEKEVVEKGLDLPEVLTKSVENIETIYLHLIRMEKEIASLKKDNAELEALIKSKR